MEIVFNKVSFVINKNTPLEKTIWNNVSFSITEPLIYSFVSSSNSGKTAIGELISFLHVPTKGDVKIGRYKIKVRKIKLNKKIENNENEEEKEKNITEGNNNQYKEIYENAYLNLIFCLIRSEYYAEALETIEEFKENNNEISQYKSILDNYAIEVYLRLGDFEKALNLAKENLSNENQDEKGSFLSNSNNQVYNEITYRLALYINLIKINILNNNFKEAQKYIVSVLSLLNYPTEKELPPYVINIIVFYFLSIGKNEEAVQIIKFRRIPKFYNN